MIWVLLQDRSLIEFNLLFNNKIEFSLQFYYSFLISYQLKTSLTWWFVNLNAWTLMEANLTFTGFMSIWWLSKIIMVKHSLLKRSKRSLTSWMTRISCKISFQESKRKIVRIYIFYMIKSTFLSTIFRLVRLWVLQLTHSLILSQFYRMKILEIKDLSITGTIRQSPKISPS